MAKNFDKGNPTNGRVTTFGIKHPTSNAGASPLPGGKRGSANPTGYTAPDCSGMRAGKSGGKRGGKRRGY